MCAYTNIKSNYYKINYSQQKELETEKHPKKEL